MRIRLTLDITRTPKPAIEDQVGGVDALDALVERADDQPTNELHRNHRQPDWDDKRIGFRKNQLRG